MALLSMPTQTLKSFNLGRFVCNVLFYQNEETSESHYMETISKRFFRVIFIPSRRVMSINSSSLLSFQITLQHNWRHSWRTTTVLLRTNTFLSSNISFSFISPHLLWVKDTNKVLDHAARAWPRGSTVIAWWACTYTYMKNIYHSRGTKLL